jgi:hypothetical protein
MISSENEGEQEATGKLCGSHGSKNDVGEQAKGEITSLGKAVRGSIALLVFGVPLVAGTAALLGYGAYNAYKRWGQILPKREGSSHS